MAATPQTSSSKPTNDPIRRTSLAEERLHYEIHRYSSFSTNYFPENILVDCPTDQSSRWSAHTNNPPQYLTLKLKRPSIVKKITFGKFEKSHVCNIKKFRVYGGLDEKQMTLLLEGGLKNDNQAEVFDLRHVTEDGAENLPVLYVKIMPLLSWGPTFNFSIWYIELHGQDDPMFTGPSLRNYNTLREMEIVKLCLKHFRQQGYEAAFRALQDQTHVRLEHPLTSELHRCLVTNGDFAKAEKLIAECINEGLMDDYLNRQSYKHTWRLQQLQSYIQPGTRGGHQLVIDNKKRLVYLYGGWDGFQDLSDLWVFDIVENKWSMIFGHSEQFNGPTPRSCHKMIFDPVSENIFMLGRYLDNSIRTTEYIKSDFYLYDTRARTWLQINDDTSQVGGPQLVYDHQMCIDAVKRTIYVFGGKILTPRSVTSTTSSEPEYSGLFSYHIATNTWTQILVDCHHPSAAEADVLSIKSRITHCMVFHNRHRKLYIYGGQRGKEDIDDFLTYDVDTQAIEVLNKDNLNGNAKNEPSPGYTLRATIDCDRNEIFVFSSLSKLKDRRDVQHIDASNSFWVYSMEARKWTRIYTCRYNPDANASENHAPLEPCPRYAHQLIYDDVVKMHYLFGGNPGKNSLPQLRLDDFWILGLEKPKRAEVLNHCRFLVRKLHYEEMTRSEPFKAMKYLRTYIAEVIDHTNAAEITQFHKLAALLFKADDNSMDRPSFATPPLSSPPRMTITSKPNAFGIDDIDDAHDPNCLHEEDEELSHKSDSDNTNPAEDFSFDSLGSTATMSSGISDDVSYSKYRRSGGKQERSEYLYDLKTRRAYLFNKVVQLMPSHMVQPDRNLSDFVVM